VAILGRTSDAVLDRSLRAKEALAAELGRARARRRRQSGWLGGVTDVPPEAILSPAVAASAARVAPAARIIGPAAAIKGLYAAFNARDAEAAASFLADDCVYEDLLLGPSTVCRGKRAFYNAIRFHPAFVSSQLFSRLPLADRLPKLELVVDSVAEGEAAVGVEWHVEIGEAPFPLGRGLTQVRTGTGWNKERASWAGNRIGLCGLEVGCSLGNRLRGLCGVESGEGVVGWK
jgi:hypothetical protein